MRTHNPQGAALALRAPGDPVVPPEQRRNEILDGLDLIIESGTRQFNEVERFLASEPGHRDELRRRLREADGALRGSGPLADDRGEQLWSRAREAWREAHAPLIAARRALAEAGANDQHSLAALRAAVDEHLAQVVRLGDDNPWAVPGPNCHEAGRGAPGLHALDALVAGYLDELGQEGSVLRNLGHQAAEEIRTRGRARWASWAAAAAHEPPPWERWRNRALFPTILARVLWLGEVKERVARLHAKPPGTIYAVFRSIARVSSPQLHLGLDDQGCQAIVRQDRRRNGLTAVADVPALSEEIFTRGLTLLGSRYTLPLVEWLVERAHVQALGGADRPDVIEIEGGWEAFTAAVLEKRSVHPVERARLHNLARMLASTSIRWQDGARSSSLFMLFEDAAAAGRGRGRSLIRFTLDARLLEHEHHRARDRFGPGPGPAQWADWRIVPLPRRVDPLQQRRPTHGVGRGVERLRDSDTQ
jgi:hypothetical protein